MSLLVLVLLVCAIPLLYFLFSRPMRFSLRSLLIVMTAIAIVLAVVVSVGRYWSR